MHMFSHWLWENASFSSRLSVEVNRKLEREGQKEQTDRKFKDKRKETKGAAGDLLVLQKGHTH